MECTDSSEVPKKKKPPSMTPSPSASAVVDSVLQYMESVSVSEPASEIDSSTHSSAVAVASSAGEITNQPHPPIASSSGASIEQSPELVTASASQSSASGHIPVENDLSASGHVQVDNDEVTDSIPGQIARQNSDERENNTTLNQGGEVEGKTGGAESITRASHGSNDAEFTASGVTLSNVGLPESHLSRNQSTAAGTRKRQNRSRSPALETQQHRTRTPPRAARSERRRHRGECWTCPLCNGRGHTARGCPNAAVPASTTPTSDRDYLSRQTFHQMLNTIPDAAQLSAQAIDFNSAAPARSLENYTPSVHAAPYFHMMDMFRNILASMDSTIHGIVPPQQLPQRQPLPSQAAQVGSTQVPATPVVSSHESTQDDQQTDSPSDPMDDDADPPQEPSA